jgi:O-antigen/teichoic acid export membrane protein
MLKDEINYLYRLPFVRRVASLQSGTMLGNFIQALAGIFVARLLQPELFGVYAVSFGLASLASILLGAGIQEAMVTILGGAYARKDKEKINEAYGFLLKATIIMSGLSLLIVIFLPLITKLLYLDYLRGQIASIVVVAAIFSTLSFSFALSALQLIGQIKQMALLTVFDQTIRYSLSVLFIWLGFGLWGAAVGHLVGAILIFCISIFIWRWARIKDQLIPSLRKLVYNFWRISLRKYYVYSFWVAADRNMGNLYMSLPVVLAGFYLLSNEVTYFKLSFGFVNLALSLLGPISVLLNVELPKMQVEDKNKMFRNFVRVSFYSLGLSTFLTVGAIAVSPIAFKILYGDSFMPSIKYIAGLIIYGCLFGIGVGLGPMWRAVNKVKVSILINTIILGLGIPSGLVAIKYLGVWGAVVMVTVWFTTSHFTSFFYLYKFLKKERVNQ